MLRRYFVLFAVLTTVLNAQAGGSAQSRSGSHSDSHSQAQAQAQGEGQSQSRGDAQRQTAPASGHVGQESAALLAEQLERQKRRDVLRQATQVQLPDSPGPTRQWSAQERAELRQQLQQQRLELLK